MKTISFLKKSVSGLLVLSVLLLPGCTPHDPLDFTPLDEFLVRVLPRIDYGCCLILFQGDDIVYRKAFGNFSLETVVPVASASKWISGGVIASLIDEGLLSLDTRASEYLDNFTGPKADITIRQMFSHTHGYPEKTPADFYLPNYFPHRDTNLNSMQEAVDIITQVTLVYSPGNALYYSGMGMQVAGRIAEIVTGKSWVDIFWENIGEPCEMTATSYFAYGQTNNPNVAGSVETSVDDYGNFVRMLLNNGVFKGRRVLSEEAVQAILTNQSGDGPVLKHPWSSLAFVDPAIAVCRYGIGCWLENMDVATGEGIEISSGGAFGCNPFIYRNLDVGGVFLPFSRNLRVNNQGELYNDAHRVYLELQEVIKNIFSR
jgi:CubicO group peptidase (beta-lactamase class C family)